MILLKNISKTYKSRKGGKTKALDSVSINFEDKGMTFILGKSGSGKSSLLNIIGGLDKFDSGDMFILGKSTKDFKQADFDSYRNTYIGFIFQEFNILEDYDVYENIVLALQLQQSSIDDEKIDKLLERLELKNLKRRKVNELSGGQKQRVAIARALIKDPKIILADEPTGNLDSKTGKEVLELLKEVSKDKLVIVVSHDEESANIYGDRVIRIKDGVIESDTKEVTKEDVKDTYKVIKSKLPFKDSFKLGIGSLKHKKVKLVFTIILIIFTLAFLSCTDTLTNFNFNKETSKYLADNNVEFIEVNKYYVTNNEYDDIKSSLIDSDITYIDELLNQKGYNVYDYYNGSSSMMYLLHLEGSINNNLDPKFVVIDSVTDIVNEELIGRSPENSNEIVISNYVADLIINLGTRMYELKELNNNSSYISESDHILFKPSSYEEILNTDYNYYLGNNSKVKIVGIINYDYETKSESYKSNVLNRIFVNNDFFDYVKNSKAINEDEYDDYGTLKYGFKVNYNASFPLVGRNNGSSTDCGSSGCTTTVSRSFSVDSIGKKIEYYDGTKWVTTSSLSDNEIILGLADIYEEDDYNQALNNFIEELDFQYYSSSDEQEKNFFANYVKDFQGYNSTVNLQIFADNTLAKEYNGLKVIGVSKDSSYVSKNLLTGYEVVPFERVSSLYLMSEEKDFLNALNKIDNKSIDENMNYKVSTIYSDKLELDRGTFDTIKTLASYTGIVFLVFTMLLITNFMFNSISYRKKEIGILRSLGARGNDVTKIFIWEATVISLISGTIASILLVIISNAVNNFFLSKSISTLAPFAIGIRQFVVVYLLVFVMTYVASVLPIRKISKMKPIDAILNK